MPYHRSNLGVQKESSQKSLLHWLNRRSPCRQRSITLLLIRDDVFGWTGLLFSTGLTDAPSVHASVQWHKPVHSVRTPMATFWSQSDWLNRRPYWLNQWSRLLCSGLATVIGASPLYISRSPGSFMMHLTHWIPEATQKKRRESVLNYEMKI